MVVLAFACIASVFWYGFIFTTFVLFAFLLFSVVEFFRFSDKTNRELQQFLLSIKYHDFSNKYASDIDVSNKELRETYNMVTSEFNRLKMEKEFNHIFLQSVVEHLPIGIICCDGNGDISLFNIAAKEYAQIEYLANFEQLEKVSPALYKALQTAKSSSSQTVTIQRDDVDQTLSVSSEEIPLGDGVFTLYLLQNIKNELERQEIESWQKLIRVITHEIMNSITPIASLSATLHQSLQSPVDAETQADLLAGMNAIKNRSETLTQFVESYRQMARIPKPQARHFDMGEMLQRIINLHENTVKEKHISLQCSTAGDLDVFADPAQIEQVLTNLVNNAIDAVGSNGKINLTATRESNFVQVAIADSGQGISFENLDKIFIPFYTTKEHGSGIGLTLSRQLLYNNRASIFVQSEQGRGTVFTIKFWE